MAKTVNRELISLEISRHHWAITEPALNSIIGFVESDEDMAFETFHNEDEKPSAYFGEAVEGSYYSYKSGGVGVLVIDGPIIPRATWFSRMSGLTSIDVATDEYKAMLADDDIKEIVLAMDTPGGVTTGISDFAALVKSSSKTTTAFTWMAASAGYWIASAADSIVSPIGGMVGSIGVVMSYTDSSEKDKKSGVVRREIVSSQSPNKRANPDTESGRAVVQTLLDDLAEGFVSTVADNRGKTNEEVLNSFGGGAVFAEARALEAGMIDAVMDFESFINSKSNQPNKLFGFSMEGKEPMSDEKKEISAEGREVIARAERERMQSIESLMCIVEGNHPDVVKAASDTINSIKYDASMTKVNAEVEVLRAVSKAQTGVVSRLEASKKESNNVAAHVGAANADKDTADAGELLAKADLDDLMLAVKEGNR